MKKAITVGLITVMLIGVLTGCSQKEKINVIGIKDTPIDVVENEKQEDKIVIDEQNEEQNSIEKLTLPKEMTGNTEFFDSNLFLASNDTFETAELNENGEIVVTIKTDVLETIRVELRDKIGDVKTDLINAGVEEIILAEDESVIRVILHSDIFKEVSKSEKSEDITIESLVKLVLEQKVYENKESKVTVEIIDIETKELIFSTEYIFSTLSNI